MRDLSRSVTRNAWIQGWARLGFAVGGVVYLLIGAIAVLVAVENRGRPSGPQGAIQRIGAQPYGHILLLVVAIGLFGYALWCFIQALFDTDQDGSDLKGIVIRVGEFCCGLGYVGLAMFALHRMLGVHAVGAGTQRWTAELLRHSWGPWLVGLLGFIFVVAGIGQLFYAWREGFRRYLRLAGTSGSDGYWIIQLGKWGYSALSLILCMIGAFLVNAAIHSDAQQARGLDGALQVLAQQRYGPWILGMVAAGLAAYGVFMLLEVRYRRI